MYAGDYAEAERLLMSTPRPELNVWTWNLMVSLAGQRKFDEAERSLEEAQVAQPENIYLPGTRALFFATQGRSREALAELNYPGSPPDAVRGWETYVASVALAQAGQLDQARDSLARSDEVLSRVGTPVERIFFSAPVAFITGWMEGDPARGVEKLEGFLAELDLDNLDPVDRSLGRIALLLAVIGFPNEALAFVERYRVEVPSEGDPFGRAQAAVAEALAEILGGASPEEAELEASTELLRCARCRSFYLGYGFEQAGEDEKAIQAYEAYLRDGFYDASLYELHLPTPVVHERLGALYEGAGDAGKAAGHYREFARRWAEADPQLQPRVQRALEKAAELGG
jgi:tetratricopeptide (TPR) repeat protein